MCVADLNVSLSPCGHRWFRLVRPCSPGMTLGSCDRKLALEGWEIKCDFCPFCAGWGLANDEYQLLGAFELRTNICSPLSRTSSMSTTVSTARRDSRRGSLTRSDSSSSVVALSSPVYSAGERNRGMSQRLDSYLNDFHHLQEARSRPAASPAWASSTFDDTSTESGNGASPDSESNSAVNVDVVTNMVGKGWKKAKRRTKDFSAIFK